MFQQEFKKSVVCENPTSKKYIKSLYKAAFSN